MPAFLKLTNTGTCSGVPATPDGCSDFTDVSESQNVARNAVPEFI